MDRQIFVARERELEKLGGFLKNAIDTQGLVCFVTGEAGAGKTALVTEFARRAQEQNADLTVAFGQCDAQTGVGDAHLPFREVLGQLTGDVEAKVARGVFDQENATRLKKLIVLSGQALAELGPDLIGIFVPGIGLATRVGTFAAEKAGWLDKLEQLVKKPQKAQLPGTQEISQNQIFEQYTNVLNRLSGKHPLLIILDDIQWADSASIGMLFHLARRIRRHRILILGTYRPEEVAIGRAGERHPLEKVLAEIKRYYGDASVDLNRAVEDEGWSFVNAFLDTEPNLLGDEFRRKLFQHTSGHPLFTIELLRNMQERGDLVQDEEGRYVETPTLTWEALPIRVEGVIEERIGRLEGELRQMLTVGCVEGEHFTAEVVARVREAEALGIVQQLSGELEKRHRLVRAQGVRQLNHAGQRLSLYKFQHNLFQKFLYNELDEAGRAYLHESVGNALEGLYGDQVDEIAMQLARHFEEAGVPEKARIYLEKAGRQAAALFSNEEAVTYFTRALNLTPDDQVEERYTLLLARERIYDLQGERDAQEDDLHMLKALCENLGDPRKQVEVALRQAAYANITSDFPGAAFAAQEAIRQAETVMDVSRQAVGYYLLGNAAFYQGDYKEAYTHLEQALTSSRDASLRQVMVNSLRTLGTINAIQGNFKEAGDCFEESLMLSQEIGDRRGEGKALNNLGIVFYEQGDLQITKTYFEQALPISRETGDRQMEMKLLGNLGVISARLGNLEEARNYYQQGRFISLEIDDRKSEGIALGNLGDVSVSMGDLIAAQKFYLQALELVREIGSKSDENFILNGLGYLSCFRGEYTTAKAYAEESLQIARELGQKQDETIALCALGFICDCVGDYSGARDYYEDSLGIALDIGFRQGEGCVLANQGLLHHHLDDNHTAQDLCLQAIMITQEVDDPIVAASALVTLGHSRAEMGQIDEAEDAYQQSLTLRRKSGQSHLAMEPISGLAQVRLNHGEKSEAQGLVEEILSFLDDNSIDGTQEPLRIYLTCYRVLRFNEDQRAAGLLNTAYGLLEERARKIDDETMRRSYMEGVGAHREIVKEILLTS